MEIVMVKMVSGELLHKNEKVGVEMALREYGGYIELETNNGKEYHADATALNCGRNCLAYLIKNKNIQTIWLPYFLCSSVLNICKKCGVSVRYYHIDETFHPCFDHRMDDNDWLYVVNYYGQLSNNDIMKYGESYGNIIVDNAQAFFQIPVDGVDTLYTCRKFFGVSDGAYLYTDVAQKELETDISFERMRFLLGRYEKSANEFYGEYVSNNHLFADEPVKAMSKLTHNLLRGMDYDRISNERTENFSYLHSKFQYINQLQLQIPEGPFMYPLWLQNGRAIRKKLQQQRIYIPTLWPDVLEWCGEEDLEWQMAADILPIPIDQRYSVEDMHYLARCVRCIS